MLIKFLGTGSNGGVPQWDCCCPHCARARDNPRYRRTRSSIAVSLDGDDYLLIDATPDLKFQLEWSGLTPHQGSTSKGYRQSRIKAVLLTHGHGDHTSGLAEFSTGKSFNIPVYAPPDLIDFLFGTEERISYFGELGRLSKDYVIPHPLRDEELNLLEGLRVKGFEVEHTDILDNGARYPSSTYGYELTYDGKRIIYTPDLGNLSYNLMERASGADIFVLDATFWSNDELDRLSGMPITSYDLGHVPMEDSLEALESVDVGRILYTHINHTNPVNNPHSCERSLVEERGVKLAHDGMTIEV
ncbi:MAG: MBL fold metallo-hydrolase [Candidatus Bathyarchaeia archaeon]